jgi:uncharacterized membrane protein (DUF4010 family)
MPVMTAAELAPLALAGRLVLALALAVFLGLTFEEVYKRQERVTPGGVRTFPMLALAGALLYLIEPQHAIACIVGLVVLAIWLYAFVTIAPPPPNTLSMMVPASNLIAYLIGPIALTQAPWVVVGATVTAVLLVGTREQLHGLIRLVPQDELLTLGKFLILIGIILPLVPREPVTTFMPLTPYHVWLAVVAICTLSYASYLLQRYVPVRNVTLLPAVLGGVYSSTATTIALAKQQREAGAVRSDLAAGIVAATAVMYLRLGILIALFNIDFALALTPALVALFVLGVAMAVYEWRRGTKERAAAFAVSATNPLQIPTAVTFAAIFVVISIATVWIKDSFGQTGVLVLAAIVGASDIDPFVINLAQGGVSGLSVAALSAAILIASSSNNLAKAGYALGFGGVEGARRPAAMLVGLALVGYAAAVIYALWRG